MTARFSVPLPGMLYPPHVATPQALAEPDRRPAPPILGTPEHDVMANEVLLPSQCDPVREWPREKILMASILDQALVDISRGWTRSKRGQLDACEAMAWVNDNRSDWHFSFVSICDTLGLDVGAVRAAIHRMSPTGTVSRLVIDGVPVRSYVRRSQVRVEPAEMRRRGSGRAA